MDRGSLREKRNVEKTEASRNLAEGRMRSDPTWEKRLQTEMRLLRPEHSADKHKDQPFVRSGGAII